MLRPVAVQRVMDNLEYEEAELREYVNDQRRFFDQLIDKNTDFVGWLAFKLTCSIRDAKSINTWASEPKRQIKGGK